VAATQRQLSLIVGASAGNILTITAPKVILDAVNSADREGIRVDEIPFRLAQNAGDDELTLNFT
jgi:hypothetical protein